MLKTVLYLILFLFISNAYASNADKKLVGIVKKEKEKTQEQATSKKVEAKKQDSNKTCLKLKQIDVDESVIFDELSKKSLLTKYLNKCVDGKSFKEILQTVSQFYIDKGTITTKPYLKSQNIQDGQLDISVITGIVEDIVDSQTKESNGKIKTAFLSQKDEPLNLRDLETSLEMINRVPSVSSKFEIKPGTKQGTSIVEINTQESTPYHLTIGVTGEKTLLDNNPYLTVDASIDNPLDINDILTLKYNGSRIQKDYQSTSGKELNYTFPLGSYLIEYVLFDFLYDQQVSGLNDTYISSGATQGYTLKVNKILFRNQANKLQASFLLQHKNTKNYFANQLIEVSSYKTTVAQIDLTHTYIQNWGQLISTYSYYRGTNWLGARTDSYANSAYNINNKAKLQFTKHSLDMNLFYYLPDKTYQLNSNFHIQRTDEFLYDTNKLSVGSYYTVRGYSSSYYGNNAWYLRNDFTKTFSPNLSPLFLQTISPLIGLDYGEVACQEDNSAACGKLVGAAVGVKTDSEKLSSDFTWSRAIKVVPSSKLENLFRYSLTLKF